jgi:hypothetical protein
VREGTGGGAFHGVGEAGGAALWNYDSRSTGGERGAHDRAQIVGIFDAIEQHEEALRSLSGEKVIEFDGRLCCAECGYALMFAGADQTIDLKAIFETNWNAFGFCELNDGFDALTVTALGDQNTIQRAAGGQSLLHCVKTGQPVHGHRCFLGTLGDALAG